MATLPPPTTNRLAPHERAQLRRKATKLGKLLGSMPYVSMDSSDSDMPSSPTFSTCSSSPSTESSDVDSSSSLFRTTSLVSCQWVPSKRKPHARRTLSVGPWSRLSRSLGPASSPETHYISIRSPSPSPSSSSTEEDAAPSFRIPSTNSVRLQKMDKLRRTLGDDVPVHLVFRAGLVHPPPPPPPPSKELPPLPARASNLRDSISYPSPHKAPRSIKRKPPPVETSTTPMSIEELEQVVDDDMRRLFAILEEECMMAQEQCSCNECLA